MGDKSPLLPVGWKHSNFGQLAEFVNGYAFAPDDWQEDGLPIIRIAQLRDEKAKSDYYDKSLPERYRVRNGDLIFSWSASLLTGLWNRGDAYLNQHLFKVINNSNVDKLFLKQLIDYYIDAMAGETHGSTMKHITRPALLNFKVIIPKEIEEQRQIAEILSTLDDAIAQTEALIRKQERIKQGLISDLLTRGVDENGFIREPSLEEFITTPIGKYPKGWQIRKMDKLCIRIVDGVHKTPDYLDDGVPFLTVENLTAGDGIDFDNSRKISNEQHITLCRRVKPKFGDILVTKDGTLGIARVVPESAPEFSIFVSIALLRPDLSQVLPEFICTFFGTDLYKKQLGTQSAGTGLKHIHLVHFRSFILPVPPLAEQKRIFGILKVLSDHMAYLKGELRKLIRLKQGLMQDLLSGQVRVGNQI